MLWDLLLFKFRHHLLSFERVLLRITASSSIHPGEISRDVVNVILHAPPVAPSGPASFTGLGRIDEMTFHVTMFWTSIRNSIRMCHSVLLPTS